MACCLVQRLYKVCSYFAARVEGLSSVCVGVHWTNHVHDQGGRGPLGPDRARAPCLGAAVWRHHTDEDRRWISRLRRRCPRPTAIDATTDRRRLVAERRGGSDRRGHRTARGHQTEPGVEEQPSQLVRQLVDAAATLDSRRIEAVLDEMFAAGTYERVIDDHVIPSLHGLGDAWAAGRLPVAGEHIASNAILRRLAASFQASGPGPDEGRSVLVGMPPGARHELGGLIFATALRRAGLPVIYLGADLPLDDWIAAVERTDAQAVVIGAVMPTDATAAISIATRLRAASPEVLIAFGGPAAPDPEAATSSVRTIGLPAGVRDAVAALGAALTHLSEGWERTDGSLATGRRNAAACAGRRAMVEPRGAGDAGGVVPRFHRGMAGTILDLRAHAGRSPRDPRKPAFSAAAEPHARSGGAPGRAAKYADENKQSPRGSPEPTGRARRRRPGRTSGRRSKRVRIVAGTSSPSVPSSFEDPAARGIGREREEQRTACRPASS